LSFRMTHEQVEAHQRRIKKAADEGRVRTNVLGNPGEANPKNRGKRSKYGAEKVELEGMKFDSRKEAKRYTDLRLMEKAGDIANLKRQVPYELVVAFTLIATYKADFVYLKDGKEVVEDVKGYKTEIYKIKKKLMKACHGIEVLET
jgi:hypothetical protein